MAAGLPGLARSISRHGDYSERSTLVCRRPVAWLTVGIGGRRRIASDPLGFFTAVRGARATSPPGGRASRAATETSPVRCDGRADGDPRSPCARNQASHATSTSRAATRRRDAAASPGAGLLRSTKRAAVTFVFARRRAADSCRSRRFQSPDSGTGAHTRCGDDGATTARPRLRSDSSAARLQFGVPSGALPTAAAYTSRYAIVDSRRATTARRRESCGGPNVYPARSCRPWNALCQARASARGGRIVPIREVAGAECSLGESSNGLGRAPGRGVVRSLRAPTLLPGLSPCRRRRRLRRRLISATPAELECRGLAAPEARVVGGEDGRAPPRGPRSEACVCLTFDDGYIDNFAAGLASPAAGARDFSSPRVVETGAIPWWIAWRMPRRHGAADARRSRRGGHGHGPRQCEHAAAARRAGNYRSFPVGAGRIREPWDGGRVAATPRPSASSSCRGTRSRARRLGHTIVAHTQSHPAVDPRPASSGASWSTRSASSRAPGEPVFCCYLTGTPCVDDLTQRLAPSAASPVRSVLRRTQPAAVPRPHASAAFPSTRHAGARVHGTDPSAFRLSVPVGVGRPTTPGGRSTPWQARRARHSEACCKLRIRHDLRTDPAVKRERRMPRAGCAVGADDSRDRAGGNRKCSTVMLSRARDPGAASSAGFPFSCASCGSTTSCCTSCLADVKVRKADALGAAWAIIQPFSRDRLQLFSAGSPHPVRLRPYPSSATRRSCVDVFATGLANAANSLVGSRIS